MAYLRARRHYLLVTVMVLLGGWIAWAALPSTASEPMVEEQVVAAESGGEQEGKEIMQPLSAAELGRYTRLEGQPLHTFTNTDLAEFLELRSRLFVDERDELPAANMACYALRCAEQPFRLFAGRFDLAEADCVTFVERTLAMAVSRNWTEYRVVSDRLRYKDGVATYRNRNFFTLGGSVKSCVNCLGASCRSNSLRHFRFLL